MTISTLVKIRQLEIAMEKDEQKVLETIERIRSKWNIRKDLRNARLREMQDAIANNQK